MNIDQLTKAAGLGRMTSKDRLFCVYASKEHRKCRHRPKLSAFITAVRISKVIVPLSMHTTPKDKFLFLP